MREGEAFLDKPCMVNLLLEVGALLLYDQQLPPVLRASASVGCSRQPIVVAAELKKSARSTAFAPSRFLSVRTFARFDTALRLPLNWPESSKVVWIYGRDQDELRCEVRPTESGFLLVIRRPGSPEQLEQFQTAGGVIARQNAIERRLRQEGWQLTDFYPTLTTRGLKR